MKPDLFLKANTRLRLVVRDSVQVRADYVFGPRHVPHRYANRTEAVARALIMVTPAGFEGFWRESASLTGDAAAHKTLGEKYCVRQLTREPQRQH
jgi:hypothetical protein